jgi:hypothetical protein
MASASGNLCYQIEHHLFPDLPSNRYAEIATRVRALCARFGLPDTTGSLLKQYLQTLRTIHRLALPDRPLLTRRRPRRSTAQPRTAKPAAPSGRASYGRVLHSRSALSPFGPGRNSR